MQAQAGTFGPAELGRAADIVNAGLTEMRGATSPRLQLELICARVLLPAAYGDERSLMARLDRIERGVQFSAGGAAAGVPAMGYVPGPEAHQGPPLRPRTTSSSPAAVPPRPGPPYGRRRRPRPRPRLHPLRLRPRPRRSRPPRPRPPLRHLRRPPPPPPVPGPPPHPRAEAARARAGGLAAGPRPPPRAAARAGPPHRRSPPLRRPRGPVRTLGAPSGAGGGLDPRMLWPNILETVKNRRRFTWILLSQNAQVTGFDGTTLQLGFVNAGARDNFLSSGSEDVLRQALTEQFNVQWKIEAVVDPSGGGGSAPSGPAGGPSGGRSSGGGGYGAPGGGAPSGPSDTRRPSAPQASAPTSPSAAPPLPPRRPLPTRRPGAAAPGLTRGRHPGGRRPRPRRVRPLRAGAPRPRTGRDGRRGVHERVGTTGGAPVPGSRLWAAWCAVVLPPRSPGNRGPPPGPQLGHPVSGRAAPSEPRQPGATVRPSSRGPPGAAASGPRPGATRAAPDQPVRRNVQPHPPRPFGSPHKGRPRLPLG
ncbi:hypothetical protein ACFQV4_03225 [Streptomyces thermocarboxydus]